MRGHDPCVRTGPANSRLVSISKIEGNLFEQILGRELSNAVVRFDFGSTAIRRPFDSHSTLVRPRYDRSIVTDTHSGLLHCNLNKLCGRPPQYAPAPVTFDLENGVRKSRVTWPTSVPILVFLGLSVLDLGLVYATDRQTSDSIIA